jgi:Anti-sigma-K factor rskA, C-terminal/Putative zinc-finger
MKSSAPDPHDLVGAYVMDAVDQADRAAFEQHLTGCDSCADEVRGLRETVARMAATEDVRPRPELRDQTMQAAARLRQVPPVVAEQAPRRRSRLLTFMRETSLAARRQSWTVRVAALAAVGCLAVAVVFGARMQGAQTQLNAARSRAHAVASVLGEPDAVMFTAKIKTGGTATVVMSHRAGELVLTAYGLPVLPRAWVYQVWLMGPAGDRSAGLLHAAQGKMAGPMLVTGLLNGDKVGLTVEPAGGAHRPTNRPILLLQLGF